MIIQQVLKGISGIDEDDVQGIFASGITCNWWRKVGLLPSAEIPLRLTERNLHWHQNRYDDPDPSEKMKSFQSTLHSSPPRPEALSETHSIKSTICIPPGGRLSGSRPASGLRTDGSSIAVLGY